ncbi:MAG: ATP synthase F0 subunit B [Proteobacteria bacterium]|nr:ATP synthase F0 subunit B [Pseudomonadota bacterium]
MIKISVLLYFLTGLSATAFASEGGGSLFTLDMLYKVVNFLILLAILHKVARKPLVNMLNSSAKTSKEEISSARTSITDAEKKLQEYTQKVADLEKELETRREGALKTIEEEKKTIVEDARKFAENLEMKTSQRINQDLQRAKDEIQDFLVLESIKMAEKLVVGSVDDVKQKSLMENYSQVLEKTA